MKKITHLLAQDERRPKPAITLPRCTATDDIASAAPVVTEAPKCEKDKEKAPLPTWTDHDRLFEALAIAEIDRLPTRVWATMAGLWLHLPSVPPSMRKRLLMHMIEEAARRNDPLPPKFVKRFARHLASMQKRPLMHMIEKAARRGDPLSPKSVKRLARHLARVLAVPEARDRIHNIEGLRAAARCRAENPKASLTDLARAAGLKTKHARQVARAWERSPEFKRWVAEFKKRRGTEHPMVPSEEGFEDRGTNAAAWLDPPRREGGHSTAYDELMAKAAAWCKEFPELTVAQIFAEIYANPAAFGCSDLVSRDQDFEKSRLEKAAQGVYRKNV